MSTPEDQTSVGDSSSSSSSSGATHYCPVCGRDYPEDGSCAVDHPNVDHLEPIENKPSDLKDPTAPAEEELEDEDTSQEENEVDPANGTEPVPGQ